MQMEYLFIIIIIIYICNIYNKRYCMTDLIFYDSYSDSLSVYYSDIFSSFNWNNKDLEMWWLPLKICFEFKNSNKNTTEEPAVIQEITWKTLN